MDEFVMLGYWFLNISLNLSSLFIFMNVNV